MKRLTIIFAIALVMWGATANAWDGDGILTAGGLIVQVFNGADTLYVKSDVTAGYAVGDSVLIHDPLTANERPHYTLIEENASWLRIASPYRGADAVTAYVYRLDEALIIYDPDGIPVGTIDRDGNAVFDGTIMMKERSSPLTAVPGYGQFLVDDVQGTHPAYVGDTGLPGSLSQTLFVGTASQTNNTSTSEETLIPSGEGTLTIPANTTHVGCTMRLVASGIYGSKTTGAGTLTMRVKLGGVVLGTFVETLSNNETNQPWELLLMITFRSIGGSGTVQPQGRWLHKFAQGGDVTGMGAFANTSTETVDTTGALTFDVTNQFSVSNGDNTITTTNLTLEMLH